MSALSWLRPVHWLRQHRWRWWEVVGFGLLGIVLVLLLLLPAFLRREIVARLSALTPAVVDIDNVNVDPFRGRLVVNGLSLTLPGEEHPVISADEIAGTARLLTLLQGEMKIEKVSLSGVRIAAVRDPDGHMNLGKLLPPAPEASPGTDLPVLIIEQLRLSDTGIDYRDLSHAPETRVKLSLSDLTTGLINLQATGLAAPIPVQVQGALNASEMTGEAQVLWRRSETMIDATINVQQLSLAPVEPYLRGVLAARQLSGQADAQLRYHLQSGGEQPPVHTLNGTLTVTEASFIESSSGRKALQVEEGKIVVEHIDFLRHDIRVASLHLRDPHMLILHGPGGLNWAALVNPQADSASASEQGGASPAWRLTVQSLKASGGEIVYRDSAWSETEAIKLLPEEVEIRELGDGTAESPLRFSARVADGRLTGKGSVRFSPVRVSAETQLSGVTLSSFAPVLTRISPLKRADGKLSGTVRTELTMNEGAPVVAMNGALDTSSFVLEGLPSPENVVTWGGGHIEVREKSTLTPLKLDTTVQLSNATVQRLPQGDVSVESVTGALLLSQQGEAEKTPPQPGSEPSEAAQPFVLAAQGTFEVKSFLLAQGPEKQELLSCYVTRARLKEGSRILPLDLRFADVALEYPYIQGFRTAVGQFQLTKPASPGGETPPASVNAKSETDAAPAQTGQTDPAPPTASSLIHVDRVSLIGGQLYFEDHALTPPQTIYWQDVRIDLSDVNYPLTRPATFSLRAFNMDGAPIEVRGTTQRQRGQLVTRVHGSVERVTLSRFNAYLAPLLGYRVRTGAVSVTWDLVMPGNLLQAQAAVTLHNLGLGGKESHSELETQVGLPMSLAIALLKDLNGNIDLQLPVEGRLDEPGFRLGGTVWRAIRDVLIGAVTSPLKLLGAIFRGKDKLEDFLLEPIPFVPGTSVPTTAGQEQLQRLKLFLAQRPELNVRLSSPPGTADRQALQNSLVLAQINNTIPPPQPPAEQPSGANGEAQRLSPEEEVRRLLTSSLNPVEGGLPQGKVSEEARKLLDALREKVKVTPQDLERLSQERLQVVIGTLTEDAGVTTDRLHLSPEKLRGQGGAEVRYMIQTRERKQKQGVKKKA